MAERQLSTRPSSSQHSPPHIRHRQALHCTVGSNPGDVAETVTRLAHQQRVLCLVLDIAAFSDVRRRQPAVVCCTAGSHRHSRLRRSQHRPLPLSAYSATSLTAHSCTVLIILLSALPSAVVSGRSSARVVSPQPRVLLSSAGYRRFAAQSIPCSSTSTGPQRRRVRTASAA
jgi:hypothetical protein